MLKTIPVGDGGDSCRGSKTRLCDTEGDNNAAARAGNARDLGVETGADNSSPADHALATTEAAGRKRVTAEEVNENQRREFRPGPARAGQGRHVPRTCRGTCVGEKGGEGGMNCERGAGGGTASASMRRERERAARELAAAGGRPRSLPPFPLTLYRWERDWGRPCEWRGWGRKRTCCRVFCLPFYELFSLGTRNLLFPLRTSEAFAATALAWGRGAVHGAGAPRQQHQPGVATLVCSAV